jgi:molybdenum cofactor cytidylyltransferase
VKTYAALILAAGLSSRMKEFKPLLTLENETITDRAMRLFDQPDTDIYLVTGWQRDKLLAGISRKSANIVENPDFASGMFSSVHSGVKQLGDKYQAFFVLPVDIPLVRPYTINLLKERFEPDKIIYPVIDSKRGHPPLIPNSLIPEILDWKGNGGLKAILKKHEVISIDVEVPDSNILFDMDTREDYQAAQKRLRTYDIPSSEEREAIFRYCGVDPARQAHCKKVTVIAERISRALVVAGHPVDIELVKAAASLHDIVRDQPKHDVAAGKLLNEMGFSRTGDIVAVHTFLQGDLETLSLESKLVYLADKFVQGDTLVSLKTRFQTSKRRFEVTPEIGEKIKQRLQRAYQVKAELELKLGYSLDSIIFN